MFMPEVVDELKWYVCRLITPREGETFYVVNGRGNRVFDHPRSIYGISDEYVADPRSNVLAR